MNACFCVGPQNGAPACPCQMRDVHIHNGRYVRTQDLGPAPNGGLPPFIVPKPWNEPREGTRIVDPVSKRDLGRAD